MELTDSSRDRSVGVLGVQAAFSEWARLALRCAGGADVSGEVQHRVLEITPALRGGERVGETCESVRVRRHIEEARDQPAHVRVHCRDVFVERVYQDRASGIRSDTVESQQMLVSLGDVTRVPR